MALTTGIASRTLTFVLAGGQGRRLDPLTRHLAKPVVTFAGKYRLIDFTLSNCVNSGLRRIHVLTQHQSESVETYVDGLSHAGRSLSCLSPAAGSSYEGTADAIFKHLALIEAAGADFVLILSGDHVYRMDYRELIAFHEAGGADATVAAIECPATHASQFGVLEMAPTGRVIGFEEKPLRPRTLPNKPGRSLASMGVYVFTTRALIAALRADAAQADSSHDFGKNVIPELVRRNAVTVYNFTQHNVRLGSYWRDVGTLDSYFRANMELLADSMLDPYENARWPLHTAGAGEGPRSGNRGTRTVVSSGVEIGRSTTIENSILLHNVQVGAGVRIDRAIVGENARIADGVRIGSGASIDPNYGFLTEGGVVVIPPDTYVAPTQKSFAAHAKWATNLAGERPLRAEARLRRQ